jgi:hypothetical protein
MISAGALELKEAQIRRKGDVYYVRKPEQKVEIRNVTDSCRPGDT